MVTTYLDESLLGELLVDLWSVCNVLGSVCVVESGECLLYVGLGRGDRGDDGGLSTTTQ